MGAAAAPRRVLGFRWSPSHEPMSHLPARPGAWLVRAAAALSAAAAALACAAGGSQPGGAVAAGELLPLSGSDTVTIVMLEDELIPEPVTTGFTAAASREPSGGPLERITDLVPADTVPAPFLRIALLRASADARDVLDRAAAGPAGAADVLVTRDPAAIAYARARPGFSTAPLAWDRVHVAVISDPSRTRIAASEELRTSLARDAVRSDARPAASAYDWYSAACHGTVVPGSRAARRIVYVLGDQAGREIADRLVAVDGSATSAALEPGALAASLAAGAEAVYIVRLPIAADGAVPCASLPLLPATAVVVPLVETRAHAIIRDGTPALVIEPGAPLRYAPAAASDSSR